MKDVCTDKVTHPYSSPHTPSLNSFIISVTLCLLLGLRDLFVQIGKSLLDELLCSVNSSQQQTRI